MIVLIAAAVLPAAFLLYRVYKMDTIEKEPWSILRKLLLWGALSGIPAALVESLLTGLVGNLLEKGTLLYNFIFGFIVAALVEESFKFFFLYKFTFKSPHFNYRFDGVVYAVFVSMGFAILENVLYVFQGGLGVAVSRALLALPLHAACGVYMGIAYGQQKVNSLYAPAPFGSLGVPARAHPDPRVLRQLRLLRGELPHLSGRLRGVRDPGIHPHPEASQKSVPGGRARTGGNHQCALTSH